MRLKPFERVEVAPEVRRSEPPVMVTPLADERPPLVEIAMPPEKVEVAVLVMFSMPEERMEPPVMVRPEADERPPLVRTERPPVKVLVALFDWEMEPAVIVTPPVEERPAVVMPPVKVEEPEP